MSGAAHRARRSARRELREREGTRPDRLKAPTLQVPSLAEHAAPLRRALSAPHARPGAVWRGRRPVFRTRRPLLGNSVAPTPLLSRRCGARGRRRVSWRRSLDGRCGDDRRQSVRQRGAGPSQPRRLPRGAERRGGAAPTTFLRTAALLLLRARRKPRLHRVWIRQ